MKRKRVLQVLMEEQAYSDVVREAQELVELALKGMLRSLGVDPPKWHDVGPILVEHKDLLPADVRFHANRLSEISGWLRKEREFAFYGNIDLIPTEQYKEVDAQRAIDSSLRGAEGDEAIQKPRLGGSWVSGLPRRLCRLALTPGELRRWTLATPSLHRGEAWGMGRTNREPSATLN